VEVALQVDVAVVADVVDDLDDPAAGELELGLVLARDGVAAVVADAETFAAEAIARRDRPELVLRHDPVVDVELERAKRLVGLARALLGELDPDDVGPGGGRVGDQPLLGRDAEEV
jgi:hypothetical protein